MCPLRRVEDCQAGPSALGLLLPPGRQTYLIVRPRSLSCDLLLVEAAGSSVFQLLAAHEGPGIAQKVYRALEQGTAVETVFHPQGLGFRLQLRVGSFALVVCTRQPGQPYQPQVFADSLAVQQLARTLAGILCPPADVEQEIYFNSRHFTP